jgi:Protein of unknown function (DUF3302)
MAFTLQGFGPFLHWITLIVLCAMPVVAGVVLYKLGGLPGSIAARRGHPQAAAINVCGWMGLITLVLWPIAMVWAHLNRGSAADGSLSAASAQSVLSRLQQASQRLAAIEAKLSKTTGHGA